MTASLFSHQGRLPAKGYLSIGFQKVLGFDKCGRMGQEITGVQEQT